jgi:predicted enzyme related to lactoylglutathione lyase
MALFRKVDAVSVPVADLDAGLAFYRDALGHELLWRNDELGQAALRLPETDAELVLTTNQAYEPNDSADEAAATIVAAGGALLDTFDIPVGRVAVVTDPFGNRLVLVDLSKGLYTTGEDGAVTGVSQT